MQFLLPDLKFDSRWDWSFGKGLMENAEVLVMGDLVIRIKRNPRQENKREEDTDIARHCQGLRTRTQLGSTQSEGLKPLVFASS